jgi:chromosome partitioning protein
MSTVICMASSKGGPGKSTLTVILAGVYAASKYSVLIIDADAQQRLATEWYDADRLPENISVTSANHATIADKIAKARSKFDVVIVDVEGSASLTLANGVFNSDCILIPANKSTMDVKDALATAALVQQYNAQGGSQRTYGIVWNRVAPAIRSRETDNIARAAIDADVPIIFEVCERNAYRALFSYGTILNRLDKKEVPGVPKAIEEGLRFAEAVALCMLGSEQKEVA